MRFHFRKRLDVNRGGAKIHTNGKFLTGALIWILTKRSESLKHVTLFAKVQH